MENNSYKIGSGNICFDYHRIHGTDAPESMTIDRLGELDELVVAQTTQLCCRQGCCRPSINWVLLDSSNYELGNGGGSYRNPLELPSVGGWIHEEATFFQRCLCQNAGTRETRFVHHAGLPPDALGTEDYHWIQAGPTSSFLTQEELLSNIVAVHEKSNTCSTNCCCCPNSLPYLRTMDSTGRFLGETRYICDSCIFVPKFLVLDQHHNPRFLLRPDTCWGGLCIAPRFGGKKGKCYRLPFLVRDPTTMIPFGASISTQNGEETETAQVTQLWSGLANEVCFKKRHAYHIAFPVQQSNTSTASTSVPLRSTSTSPLSSCSIEDKLVLIGSSILIDVAMFENEDDK
jgi:hypothetical protein